MDKLDLTEKYSKIFAQLRGLARMPHAQLASRGLYRTPRLPEALTALGFTGNAAGYADLEQVTVKQTGRGVSTRSVQLMLYQGQYLKYAKCLAIRNNILAFQGETGKSFLSENDDFIEEHEYYIDRLQNIIDQVAVFSKISPGDCLDMLSQDSGLSAEFIREMMKYRRCLKSEAEAVQSALVARYPQILVLKAPVKGQGQVHVRVKSDPIQDRDTLPIAWVIRRADA